MNTEEYEMDLTERIYSPATRFYKHSNKNLVKIKVGNFLGK